MSILSAAKQPTGHDAPLITIVAGGGVGKTTLAGLFKKPLIVALEDGLAVYESWSDELKPFVVDLSKSKDIQADLKQLMVELGTTEHDYSTVIYDTTTTLNLMYEEKICKDYKVSTVADAAGGFHKGYDEVASWHKTFIGWCRHLSDTKKISSVFLAHSEIIKMKNNPDDAGEYVVYGIGMYRKSAVLYKNLCDAVYYLTKEKFITGATTNNKGQTTKFGRVTESGERILITNSDGKTGYIDAKDRYSIGNEIPVPHGTNPLLDLIPFFNKGDV